MKFTRKELETIWDSLYGRRSQLLQGTFCQECKNKADYLSELMHKVNEPTPEDLTD